MHSRYQDIRSRIPDEPHWFDEFAVPRYGAFEPRSCADIYAREAVLLEIACQNCRRHFRVAMTRSSMDDVVAARAGRPARTLADSVTSKAIGYGDPPNIECCPSGPTMTSDALRVLEFWRRDAKTDHEWRRDPSLEIIIDTID